MAPSKPKGSPDAWMPRHTAPDMIIFDEASEMTPEMWEEGKRSYHVIRNFLMVERKQLRIIAARAKVSEGDLRDICNGAALTPEIARAVELQMKLKK